MQYYSDFELDTYSFTCCGRRNDFRECDCGISGGLLMKLPNYVSGRWSEGLGPGELLIDPVTGDELASISSQGIDLDGALQFARAQGGPALRQLTYAQRAEMLAK